MEPASHEIVLVPNDGFRRARALTTPANVVVERDGRTLTAGVFPERDDNVLCVTVVGVEAPPPLTYTDRDLLRPLPRGTARLQDDHGRVVDLRPPQGSHHSGPFHLDRPDGGGMFLWWFILGTVWSDTTSLELTLDGDGGDWRVRIPVEIAETTGILAKRCAISEVHGGVLIKATAVARSNELCAVELDAYCVDAAGDEIRGSKWDSREVRRVERIWIDEAILRDDHGLGYQARPGQGGPPYGGGSHRRSAWFQAVPAEVRLAVLEIPSAEVHEVDQERLDLPIPSDIELEYDGCQARIVVTRIAARDGSRARVEVTPIDPDRDRHLLYFRGARVDGKDSIGMTIARSPDRPPIVEVPDPTGTGERILLSFPIHLISGPWRLPLEFD